MQYTVNGLLEQGIKVPCLIIGTFMTIYDVHINRMPTTGFLKNTALDAMQPNNLTMSPVEKKLLNDLQLDNNELKYNRLNERRLCTINCFDISQPYYLLQVADFEVDVISHFYPQNKYLAQGHKFAAIKFGSQVDMIIPFVNKNTTFKSLVNDSLSMHVEAGMDKLVSIERR